MKEVLRLRKLSTNRRGTVYAPFTEEHKRKIGLKSKGRSKGEKSHHWKGEAVGYSPLHRWVRRWLGYPKECVYCGVRDAKRSDGVSAIQYANVSHQYHRELSDWIPLCVPCHTGYDSSARIKNTLHL